MADTLTFLKQIRDHIAKGVGIAYQHDFIHTVVPKILDVADAAVEYEAQAGRLQAENERLSGYIADLLLDSESSQESDAPDDLPSGFSEVTLNDDNDGTIDGEF